MMSLQPQQVFDLLDKQEHVVGQVLIEQSEEDRVYGRFVPGPAFATVQHLFTEYVASVNQQLFTLADELEDVIAELGLHLHSLDGQPTPAIRNVSISGEAISFRTLAAPLSCNQDETRFANGESRSDHQGRCGHRVE